MTFQRNSLGHLVLVAGEPIGQLILLTRGQGWRAGLTGERPTGRHRTRYDGAEALLARLAEVDSPA